MNRHARADNAETRRRRHLFYLTRLRRPLIDRAEGIYMWDAGRPPLHRRLERTDGRQYRPRQPERARRHEAADGPRHLRLPPAFRERTGRGTGARSWPGDCRAAWTASSSCRAARRRWNPASSWRGNGRSPPARPSRWKVIARMPSYHGGTLGSLAVTGDGMLTDTFRRPDADDADGAGADRLSRPRQPLDGTSAASAMPTCWRRRSWPRGRRACSPSSWSRSAARRPPRWWRPTATIRASARSATATASC